MWTDAAAFTKLIPFATGDAFSEPEQLLAAYFQESTVGLCILDTEFRYLAINPALAAMNGIPAAEHLGKTCREILGEFFSKVEPLLGCVLEKGEPIIGLEITGSLPARAEVGHWSENYFPIKDASGKVKQIGVAVVEVTEQKRLEESLARVARTLREEKSRLQLLHEIDTALASNLELEKLLQTIVRCIGKVIPYDFAATLVYDAKEQVMRTAVVDSRIGEAFPERDVVPVSECLLGQSMMTGTATILRSAELTTMPMAEVQKLLALGIKSICSVPLITPKGALGALGLGSRDESTFAADDVGLLSHAAKSIALVLENALTHKALEREKACLQTLADIDAVLVANPRMGELIPAIAECLGRAVPHSDTGILVYDESLKMLREYGAWSAEKQHILPRSGLVPVQGSLAGKAFAEKRTVVVNSGELSKFPTPLSEKAFAQGLRSLCFIPLITSKGVLGVLVLTSTFDHTFKREQLELLEPAAGAIAQAVANALANWDSQHKQARLEALREIDKALLASLDMHLILPMVSASLRAALPHDYAAICVYDEQRGGLRDFAATSEIKRKITSESGLFGLHDSLTGRAFVEGKSRLYNRAELQEIPFPVTQRALEAGICCSCFVPLETSKGRVGVLTVCSSKEHAFRADDLSFLESVGSMLARSLHNALEHKELQKEKKRLQVLVNVGKALASNWDVQKAFATISAYIRRALRHEYAAFLLFDEKNDVLVRQSIDFPFGRGLLAAAEVKPVRGPSGEALRERKVMRFSKEEMESFNFEDEEKLLREGMRSLCCVPLLRPNGPLGVLTLASTRSEAFDAEDLPLLSQVAAQMAVALENRRVSQEIEKLREQAAAERGYLTGEPKSESNFEEIIGESAVLKQTLQQVETVASSDATVLVLGETGTGKELVARAIHRMSRRNHRPFVKLNCAAIPSGLLESELFGHEKGAFTGAVSRKVGRLELADRGTLFLDEIGEIPLELQPKLLRVLQDHEFERLGGTRTIRVNLRLIAATNRDLTKSVVAGNFRSDLYYRINVFPIQVPPLRERRDDIPSLVHHFVHKFANQMGRHIESISNDTMNKLKDWYWPGNIRELENLIERSVIISHGPALRVPLGEMLGQVEPLSVSDTLENAEREHIIRILRESGGIISGPDGAARKLGLKRTTLQSKMQRLGISREDYSETAKQKERGKTKKRGAAD